MNERGEERRFAGDPLKELARNTAEGDCDYLGLEDRFTSKRLVPGIREGHYSHNEVLWEETDKDQPWNASAERYFSTYNRALVPLRHAKKLG